MYWPTGSARRLHLTPSGCPPSSSSSSSSLDTENEHQIGHLSRTRSGTYWGSVTASTLYVWSARPAQVIAALTRTKRSLQEYGANTKVWWRPDGANLAVETDKSYLLLYTLSPCPAPSPARAYSYAPPPHTSAKSPAGEPYAPNANLLNNTFSRAPGEGGSANAEGGLGGEGSGSAGTAGTALELSFRLVLRIDAGLLCACATDTHLIVSTRTPAALQCIPWPSDPARSSKNGEEEGEGQAQAVTRTTLLGKLPWVLKGSDDEDVEQVYVQSLVYSRPMDMFVWLTNDGRAYAATLRFDTRTSIWRGQCFHGAPSRRGSSSAPNHDLLLTNAIRRDDSESFDTSIVTDPGQVSHTTAADAPAAASEEANKGPSSASASTSTAENGRRAIPTLPLEKRASVLCVNAKFSLIAVGLEDGTIDVYSYRSPSRAPLFSHNLSVRAALKSTARYLSPGAVRALACTSDGHALAVGWDSGWALWSTYGKLMACSLREDWESASKSFSDSFMFGISEMFWGPGNTELVVLRIRQPGKPFDIDNQLFSIPFAKSAVAGQHSPDNTRYAFIQLDDRVLVYRGADQPDMSIINPESDVWHHVKIPKQYLAANWPIRYASISSDGRLIAVAGRRGLTHYSAISGRWKSYLSSAQEQSFVVRGGLQWFQHVLVAACDAGGQYQLRLYSRDLELDNAHLLHLETLPAPVVLTSLFDNSLLVYTADNTFWHFLIVPTVDSIRLRMCGSITFDGVVGEPARVRGMSWMIPPSQQRFGDPIDDLTVATVIFLIDGKLVLLRPRKASDEEDEVKYDMQILADRIEYYWTHLAGIGTLENSLWGYDGTGIKLWLDALTIEHAELDYDEDAEEENYKTIEESVRMPLDFYPLCVLMDKGVIIGVEPEVSLRRSLDFAIFRTSTNTHLFLHHVLRYHLERGQLREAVFFASHYQGLVYFAHALEILLHAVLEDEADAGMGETEYARSETGSVIRMERSPSVSESDTGLPASASGLSIRSGVSGTNGITPSTSGDLSAVVHDPFSASDAGDDGRRRAVLPLVVAFLDHFDESLAVVVGCARKTEVARWAYLFDVVGKPRDLFEKCLAAEELKTAGSYLLVLHNLEPLEESTRHTVRLLRRAAEARNWSLCKDLLRFLRSMDETGDALRYALEEAALVPEAKQSGSLSTPHDSPESRRVTAHVLPPFPLSLAVPPPSAGLTRSSSAPIMPTVLDTTLEEDEGESDGHNLNLEPSSAPASRSNGRINPATVLPLPTPLSDGLGLGERPPIPEVSVNGRITMPRRSSAPRVGLAGLGSPTSPGMSPSPSSAGMAGLGMSLHRVGLRSTERLWETSGAHGQGHHPPGTRNWLSTNNSPGSGSASGSRPESPASAPASSSTYRQNSQAQRGPGEKDEDENEDEEEEEDEEDEEDEKDQEGTPTAPGSRWL